MLDVPEIERLGESPEFGWRLLELLEQQGWLVHVTTPFAGAIDGEGTSGILVVCAHPDVPGGPIQVCGRSVADCAVPLMLEASRWIPHIAAARAGRAA